MTNLKKGKEGFDQIPFRMHPRVFAALGADLVTNDIVAVIELVKNSYDAFAENVWARFRDDPSGKSYLEIEDDGLGMTKEIIEDVWCVVATPFKKHNTFARSGKKVRRVAGEKGLGRLSVARLGKELHMLTQAPGASCLEVKVNWSDLSEGDDLSGSYAELRAYPEASPFKKSGTLIRVSDLRVQWSDDHISDLEENLARLISPFSGQADFNIFLSGFSGRDSQEVRIESPEFLSMPKYSIKGAVRKEGNVSATYKYSPISDGLGREKELGLKWPRIQEQIPDQRGFSFSLNRAQCGPFEFEIRAWDIASDDTQEIAERFDFQKSRVRKAIRAHKGISVYRDGILVLPKSDNARDWLGLDLRRISKVGTRLSTSQIVGYVSISAEANPNIKDTSDRERLASRLEVAQFEEILKSIVELLERERDEDRVKPDREKPMEDLFEGLSTDQLMEEVTELSEENAPASKTVPLIRAYGTAVSSTRKAIEERFVYYSRLATVGTIAHMLVHEIRNRTTAFGRFLELMRDRFAPFTDREIETGYRNADNAVNALERLADTFAPLASRSFRRRKRKSILERQIKECLDLQRGEIKRKNVRCIVPDSETEVATDPGELDAIILNLITNALYWFGDVPKEKRELEFRLEFRNGDSMVRVWVHDSGPGIDRDDVEKVFWPGLTRKPGGIGMGLTVASELTAAYGGRMSTKNPGDKGGASFAFELPLFK